MVKKNRKKTELVKEKTRPRLKTQWGGEEEEMPGVGSEAVLRIQKQMLNPTGQRSSFVGLWDEKQQGLFAAPHHIVVRIKKESEI